MIVYGDRELTGDTRSAFRALHAQLWQVPDAPDALQRRAQLASLTIQVGALAQALLDVERAQSGRDELTVHSVCAAEACLAAARPFVREESLHTQLALLAASLHAWQDCAAEGALQLRDPEGYAFYALYPELYAEAALRYAKSTPASNVQVIGIRSIGSSLSAVVAAALGSTRPALTVRPEGHPFSRQLRIGPLLEQSLRADCAHRVYAIVDEGPGMSGSSLDAVAQYLVGLGVAREQLVFFPSHDGEPGAQASEAVRTRYRATRRSVVSFEQYFDHSLPERSLARWFEPEVGAARLPLCDLSAGRWRALRYDDPADYPASYARDERRKYLLTTDAGEWLVKYAGLGGDAPRRAARARMLSDAGLTPALEVVRHGFALTRFERAARPLPSANAPRAWVVAEVVRYLTFLVQKLPARAAMGAGPDALLLLLKHNAGALLGSEAAAALARYNDALGELCGSRWSITTDNKLEPYEWLVTTGGRLLKCDAEDHHAGHDCIGSQDPAWDLAGAVIELGFDEAELEQARAALLDHTGYRVSERKLRFYQLAYAAFRAGRAHYGEQALRGWNDADADRVRAERQRYVDALTQRLA